MTFKMPRTFELKIPSRLEALEEVQHLIEAAVKEYNISEDMAFWMELTISESVINGMRHGNQFDPSKEVILRISSNGKTIEMIVEDEGGGFNLSSIADPRDIENILKPSGRGVLIIRSFVDEIYLSPRSGGGCRLRMIKQLPRQPA